MANGLDELTRRRLALQQQQTQSPRLQQQPGILTQTGNITDRILGRPPQIATQTAQQPIEPPSLTDVQAEGSPALTQQRRNRRRGKGKGKGGALGRPRLGAAARDVGKQLELGIPFGETLSPELFQDEALGRVGDIRGGETDAALQAATQFREQAGGVDPEIQAIIERRRAELGGFTTPEQEALRQNALSGIGQQFQAGLRSAQAFNLGRGIRGGLAGRAFQPVAQQAFQARRGLESDIFQQEIGERARRLQEFEGLVTGEAGRRFNEGLQARQLEAGALEQARQFELGSRQFDLEQLAREVAGRTAARGAGLGLLEQERARRERIRALKQLQQLERERQDQLLGLV